MQEVTLTSDNVRDHHCYYCRKGVAANLMSRVITEATTRGLGSVYAYVRADNKVARCSYHNVTYHDAHTFPRPQCS